MRQVVLGAGGQLARDLCACLDGEVIGLTRAQADLTDAAGVERTLTDLRPDVVYNCAAYNFVDRAESEPDAAFATNAWGVRALARCCGQVGCRLVHFSTDYVFGLEPRRSPYRETDAPGPVSVYGLSKLVGEYAVRALTPRHLVVRTCGLYGVWGVGGKGGNFVETMLRLAGSGKSIRVVTDQVCTPSYTADVAAATAALVRAGATGVVHVTNGGACSWHEFAQAIFTAAGLDVTVTAITSAEYGAAAPRPAYSVLAAEGLAAWGVSPLRSWRDALAAYLRERRQAKA